MLEQTFRIKGDEVNIVNLWLERSEDGVYIHLNAQTDDKRNNPTNILSLNTKTGRFIKKYVPSCGLGLQFDHDGCIILDSWVVV